MDSCDHHEGEAGSESSRTTSHVSLWQFFLCFALFSGAIAGCAFTFSFEEQFNYPDGNLVGQAGWQVQSAGGTNPIQVSSGEAVLTQDAGSREDAYHSMGTGLTGDVTVAFEFTVSDDTPIDGSDSEYFFHLNDEGTFNFRARIDLVLATGADFNIGISTATGTAEGTTTVGFSYNTPYVAIVTYQTGQPATVEIRDAATCATLDSASGTGTSTDQVDTLNLRQSTSSNGETIRLNWVGVVTSLAPPMLPTE